MHSVIPCALRHEMTLRRHGIVKRHRPEFTKIPDNAFGVSGMTSQPMKHKDELLEAWHDAFGG
jgi:hypothetical protein